MTDKLEANVRLLFEQIAPPDGGVLVDSYITQDVGINCYHFEVIGPDGFHTGHWTNQGDIPEDEAEIVRAILNEDCEPWDCLDEDDRETYLGVLGSMANEVSAGWVFDLRPNPDELRELLTNYDRAGDQPVEDLVGAVKEQGFLSLDNLRVVGYWKSNRIDWLIKQNPDKLVREATGFALDADSEILRIQNLICLKGVGMPTASVILHWFHEDDYPILDFRALWSLGIKKKVDEYSFGFWMNYVRFCRQIAREHGMSMRELDRALWQYSKKNQPPQTDGPDD